MLIKVSARPRKSPPKPKVQWVSGPVILPNRAYATLPAADENGRSKAFGLPVEDNMVLNRSAEQMTQRLRASAATREANPR